MASQHMAIGSFKDAQKVIEKYDSIIIFHHTRPDGDCLGSQFGLRQLIRDNYPNKKVYAIGDTGGSFSFLNFDFDNEPSDELLAKSLGIIVDANFKERIYLRQYLDKNLFAETLRIDHHPNDDDLDKCTRWVESNRIAAAEMIAELAYQTGWKVSHTAAEYIFLGMITDSGRFQFSDTSARTHELVAFLYKTGFNADKVFTGLGSNRLARFKTN
nr:bifunctional oligoribonuclease/PAP phosphatase NrnA [Mycoplasmopsis bovis]